jgi:hypothetical protein
MPTINTTNNPMRLDSNESVFFNRELAYVKAKSYDAKYAELKGLSLIPISTEAGAGVNEIIFHQYRGVGFAKVIADYAKDFPRVDIYGEEKAVKVKGIGDSYGYSIKEIRASQRTGKNLDQRRAITARRAHDEMMNRMALKSNTADGTFGLLDFPGITEVTLQADGTNSSKTWASKTPDQIVRDINDLVSAVMEPTSAREVPDTLLLPIAQYNDIATRRIGEAGEKTLMRYILDNSPYIKRIDWLSELKNFGAGGTNRALVGRFDEEHLTLEIPQPFEQFEAQQEGMEFTIPCHSECAGTIIYYPLAFAYADGI